MKKIVLSILMLAFLFVSCAPNNEKRTDSTAIKHDLPRESVQTFSYKSEHNDKIQVAYFKKQNVHFAEVFIDKQSYVLPIVSSWDKATEYKDGSIQLITKGKLVELLYNGKKIAYTQQN